MRLNNYHRDRIQEELMKGYRAKELKATRAAQAKLAREVYDFLLGKDAARIRRLPKDWFAMRSTIRVKINGHFETLKFNEVQGGPIRRPMPHHMVAFDAKHSVVGMRSPLSRRHVELATLSDAIWVDRQTLSKEIRATLNKSTTVAKLIERWPEIEKVVREVTRSPAPTTEKAVTTNLATMNSVLGLKSTAA